MITVNRVTIKPERGGFMFVNEEGEITLMSGDEALYELGGILETAAGCVAIQYEVDVPDEFAAHLEAMANVVQ